MRESPTRTSNPAASLSRASFAGSMAKLSQPAAQSEGAHLGGEQRRRKRRRRPTRPAARGRPASDVLVDQRLRSDLDEYAAPFSSFNAALKQSRRLGSGPVREGERRADGGLARRIELG